MEKKYTALITKTFTDGQALADIVKGNQYIADKEHEYFIGEFGDTIYLPKEQFDEHFKVVKIKPYQQKAKRTYQKKQVRIFITLFPTDQDIIDHMDKIAETYDEKKKTRGARQGKSEYIRRLIREDIARNKGV